MNYIILLLEFIVLIVSIGLFISKSEMTPNGPRIDINWNIALFITVILMIGINIRFICYGAYCFFSCGDESAEVQDAKKAVAIYRRAKAGKSLKAGMFGYENVDLNNLNQDDEETEFLGVNDPQEIKRIAEQNTKTLLQQNIADRQAVSKERVQARVQEHAAALKGRPVQKEAAFTPHAIQVGGQPAQPARGASRGQVLARPGEQLLPQTQMGTGPGGAHVVKATDHPFGFLGFGNKQSKQVPPVPQEPPKAPAPIVPRERSAPRAPAPLRKDSGSEMARRMANGDINESDLEAMGFEEEDE